MSKIKENIEKMAGDGSQIDPTEVSYTKTRTMLLSTYNTTTRNLILFPHREEWPRKAALDTENELARGFNLTLSLTRFVFI